MTKHKTPLLGSQKQRRKVREKLTVERKSVWGGWAYLVKGGENLHIVTFNDDMQKYICDCGHFASPICSHILAVMVERGEATI